jgi:hypothetical protein
MFYFRVRYSLRYTSKRDAPICLVGERGFMLLICIYLRILMSKTLFSYHMIFVSCNMTCATSGAGTANLGAPDFGTGARCV